MSRWVTTAAECYPDRDDERACAQITRVGGGQYRFTPLYGHVVDDDQSRTFATEDEARAAAEAFAVKLDKIDKTAFARSNAIHKAHISDLENQVAELRAQLNRA